MCQKNNCTKKLKKEEEIGSLGDIETFGSILPPPPQLSGNIYFMTPRRTCTIFT